MTLASQPELLAPAGDWDALRAAVANGANAVYFGLPNYSARYRATNFGREELPAVMTFLHDHNVRGYVALNTLIFTGELADISTTLGELIAAGVDAVIVQDLGLVGLIRAVAPGLMIHGSTQMTLTEPHGIEFVRALGVERVILARELSIENIAAIRHATTMPLEVFVHGALCVAYSGQCLTSEALGGRSANRGQCAQACRLPYELVVDGETRDFGERAYLLSPLDLSAPELVKPLLDAGVVSFKIEGRLKSAHYVAATSQVYRDALDQALAGRNYELPKSAAIDLQQSFSRGFSQGFLGGLNHQTLIPARFPKARGVRVGKIVAADSRLITVELDAGHDASILKPGDGVVFDQGRPEQDEQGGRLYEVTQLRESYAHSGIRLSLSFAAGAIDWSLLTPDTILWRTDDPAFRKRMEQTFSRDQVALPESLNFELQGEVGGAVRLLARDAKTGVTSESTWEGPLQLALKQPLTQETLVEQLGRLKETPFTLGTVENRLPAGCMLPKSVLNDLRRRVVVDAIAARATQPTEYRPERSQSLLTAIRDRVREPLPARPRISVLARNEEQLRAVLEWNDPDDRVDFDAVYCDWEDIRRYSGAVELARAANRTIGLATLRIVKPGEEGLLSIVGRAAPDRILIRNLAGLEYYRRQTPEIELRGDFSLNVTNPLTAALFRDAGLRRMVPGFDLNWDQLADLLAGADPNWFEPVVHQHMPMFHNEHCIFAAMLSTGKDWRDCGRPCDLHKVDLRDRSGAVLPLLADTGCRNTVFNAIPQSAAEYLPRMLDRGVRHFRIDLLRENAAETHDLLNQYAGTLGGKTLGRATFRSLRILNQLGVTRGTLEG